MKTQISKTNFCRFAKKFASSFELAGVQIRQSITKPKAHIMPMGAVFLTRIAQPNKQF